MPVSSVETASTTARVGRVPGGGHHTTLTTQHVTPVHGVRPLVVAARAENFHMREIPAAAIAGPGLQAWGVLVPAIAALCYALGRYLPVYGPGSGSRVVPVDLLSQPCSMAAVAAEKSKANKKQKGPKRPKVTVPPDLMARYGAVQLLNDVLLGKKPLEIAFEQRATGLDSRDRGFTFALTAATLRHLGLLDAVVEQCLNKPLSKSKKTQSLRNLLRIGAAQLLILDTPPHAAVDTSVRLAEAMQYEGMKKLVNAILRTIDRQKETLLAKCRDGPDGARVNVPDWLWDDWVRSYHADVAAAIAQAHAREAPLDITVKTDPAKWAEALGGVVLPTGTVRIADASAVTVTQLPGFEEGEWWVQDIAASLPVKLLGDLKGKKVADVCAAPGGKTLQLAAAGATVLAIDQAEKRLQRLRENLKRTGLEGSVAVVCSDAAEYKPPELFDMVLLDAPCSATGTIRRHPELPWTKSIDDVEYCEKLQAKLLAAVVKQVKVGGIIVYCTCSLQSGEGSKQVERALKELPLQRWKIKKEELEGLENVITSAGDVRSLPSHLDGQGGMDGFYIARLQRTK
uniref:SAM-dependent MTase RsmB/NOP-type domain-containing protein n=1 Tax=Eutreptiella gymnastica TaxID=73025 RepID=A0A7S1IF98_9EUGL